jgi:hypothetical protein
MIFTQLLVFTMGNAAKGMKVQLGSIRHDQAVIFVIAAYEINAPLQCLAQLDLLGGALAFSWHEAWDHQPPKT